MEMGKTGYDKIVSEIKELQKQEEDIILENMPKFERGISEASLERELAIWQELKEVFDRHDIMPSLSLSLKSDNQPSTDSCRPNLACAGIGVNISYIITPIDKKGKSGMLPQCVIEKIAELRVKKDKLERQLHGDV